MVIIVDCNVDFNKKEIFDNVEIQVPENITYTKKKNNIDIKNLEVNKGDIFNMECEGIVKGINIKKKNKKNKEGIVCNENSRVFIRHFLNQVSIYMGLGGKVKIHMMIFKNKIKLSGCKSFEDTFNSIKILFSKLKEGRDYVFTDKESKNIKFSLIPSMINLGLSIGFMVDRNKIKRVFNTDKYFAYFDPMCNINATVVMKNDDIKTLKYKEYTLLSNELSLDNVQIKTIEIEDDKVNKFIIFSSGEVIMTGRNLKKIEQDYKTFTNIIQENKDIIMLKTRINNKEYFPDVYNALSSFI